MHYYKEISLKNGAACLCRQAVEADAEDLLHCYLKTHSESDFLISYPDENLRLPEKERDYIRERSQQKDAIELCAFCDGNLVAAAGFEPVGQYEKLRHRTSFSIVVQKQWWGLGIGRAMTEICIELAGLVGYSQMELEVAAENFPALMLYESVGFREYGRNPRALRTRDGRWQETVLMMLKLW